MHAIAEFGLFHLNYSICSSSCGSVGNVLDFHVAIHVQSLEICEHTLKTFTWQEAQWSSKGIWSYDAECVYVSTWILNGTPFSPPCFFAVNSVLMQWILTATFVSTWGCGSHTNSTQFNRCGSIFTSSKPRHNGISKCYPTHHNCNKWHVNHEIILTTNMFLFLIHLLCQVTQCRTDRIWIG